MRVRCRNATEAQKRYVGAGSKAKEEGRKCSWLAYADWRDVGDFAWTHAAGFTVPPPMAMHLEGKEKDEDIDASVIRHLLPSMNAVSQRPDGGPSFGLNTEKTTTATLR